MTQKTKQAADFIVPLNMNGLEGRMLRLPPPKDHHDREILMIYGHHSSLERWWGVAQNLNLYGGVTMPDLPGFGGMDSLYKIGKAPTLDNMADYLASFVKWRYKRQKVSIIGLSYGFLVVTRMLQRYPELSSKVEIFLSAVGFSHHDDFIFSKSRMTLYRLGTKLMAKRPLPFIFRYVALQPWILRRVYQHTFNAKKKFADADPEQAKRLMDMEIVLWHNNDVRTWCSTAYDMLTVDNCQKRVDLTVWHIGASTDQYFHEDRIEQHMRVIFSDFRFFRNENLRHAPSVVADAKEASAFFPPSLRRELQKRERKRRP